jgi:hypothetical protein
MLKEHEATGSRLYICLKRDTERHRETERGERGEGLEHDYID